VVFGIARYSDLSAAFENFFPLGYSLFSVIGPFRMDCRPNYFQHMRYARLIEENNMIYAPQCRNEQYPFGFRKNRPPLVPDMSHGLVAVDGHNEYVSKGSSFLKVSQVSDMKDVETSVGQNHSLSFKKRGQILKLPQFH
jgi:hypothetical protein